MMVLDRDKIELQDGIVISFKEVGVYQLKTVTQFKMNFAFLAPDTAIFFNQISGMKSRDVSALMAETDQVMASYLSSTLPKMPERIFIIAEFSAKVTELDTLTSTSIEQMEAMHASTTALSDIPIVRRFVVAPTILKPLLHLFNLRAQKDRVELVNSLEDALHVVIGEK